MFIINICHNRIINPFKKLPSDSSASRIAQSPFPSFALLFSEFSTPPLIIVDLIFDLKEFLQ